MGYVPVTINGVAYPKNKKDPPMAVTIVGAAWVTGLGVGGGPMPGGDPPLVIWGGGNEPFPTPPIAMPPPEQIPNPPTEGKPPPPNGGWGWSPDYGWGYFPPPGSATPKRP